MITYTYARSRFAAVWFVVLLILGFAFAACGTPKESTAPTPASSASASAASSASAPSSASATPAAADAGAKSFPESVAEAEKLRAGGASWTNVEIREHYIRLIEKIQPADAAAKKDGKKAEERGKKAYQARHDARMTCRAMMTDRKEVEGLQARDKEKYGQGDGPTFEQLVDHNKKKGLAGDKIFEAIIESSQRTDGAVNEMLGVAPANAAPKK